MTGSISWWSKCHLRVHYCQSLPFRFSLFVGVNDVLCKSSFDIKTDQCRSTYVNVVVKYDLVPYLTQAISNPRNPTFCRLLLQSSFSDPSCFRNWPPVRATQQSTTNQRLQSVPIWGETEYNSVTPFKLQNTYMHIHMCSPIIHIFVKMWLWITSKEHVVNAQFLSSQFYTWMDNCFKQYLCWLKYIETIVIKKGKDIETIAQP